MVDRQERTIAMFDDVVKQIEVSREIIKKFTKPEWWDPLEDVYIIVDKDGFIGIYTNGASIENLSKARHMLRAALGSWSDKVKTVFPNFGKGITAMYEGVEYPFIRITMAGDAKTFPKELLPSGDCEIIEEEYVETRISISCPMK